MSKMVIVTIQGPDAEAVAEEVGQALEDERDRREHEFSWEIQTEDEPPILSHEELAAEYSYRDAPRGFQRSWGAT